MDKKLQNTRDSLARMPPVLKYSMFALQKINCLVAEEVLRVVESPGAFEERHRLARDRLQFLHEALLGKVGHANANQFFIQKIWLLTDSDREKAITYVELALVELRAMNTRK